MIQLHRYCRMLTSSTNLNVIVSEYLLGTTYYNRPLRVQDPHIMQMEFLLLML